MDSGRDPGLERLGFAAGSRLWETQFLQAFRRSFVPVAAQVKRRAARTGAALVNCGGEPLGRIPMIDRSEELVTVFGGDGFIGRYVCEFLARSGVRVRVASRDPRNSYFIQPLGQVGQFGFVQADITDAASVRRAVEDTKAVVNLVGVFGRKMQAVHVDGARNVAEAARSAGA